MHELGERGRDLVRKAHADLRPTTADRARVRAALAGRLGPAAASPGPASPGGVLTALKTVPLGIKVGTGVAAIALLLSLLPVPSSERALPSIAPAPSAVVALASAPAKIEAPAPPAALSVGAVATGSAPPGAAVALARAADEPAPSPRPVATSSVEPTSNAAPALSASSGRGSSLAAEVALLREAERALAAGDAKGSLAKIDELSTRFEDGVLREERLAARVLALCAAGEKTLARAEADRFLRAWPTSPHASRVRASCAFATPPLEPSDAH